MTWMPPAFAPFTVDELVRKGLSVEEAAFMAWGLPLEAQHYWQCSWCGQANPHTSNICWKCGASR